MQHSNYELEDSASQIEVTNIITTDLIFFNLYSMLSEIVNQRGKLSV